MIFKTTAGEVSTCVFLRQFAHAGNSAAGSSVKQQIRSGRDYGLIRKSFVCIVHIGLGDNAHHGTKPSFKHLRVRSNAFSLCLGFP